MFGSILMILGTAIGAGMLALPIATAHESYIMVSITMIITWMIMTFCTFSLLEVNLWMKPGSNLISMANATLGSWGKWFTWVVYLLLLYSALCAYISGSSDILQTVLFSAKLHMPRWSTTLLSVVILGAIVSKGIKSIDFFNRAVMAIQILVYLVLVFAIVPHINLHYILLGDYHLRGSSLMIVIASFTFAIIVPSLRTYLDSDVTKLKKAILIGSFLPLIIYLIWISVIQGLIPRQGSMGLLHMGESSHTNTMLMHGISVLIHNTWITLFAKVFIAACILTSFLGVSLSLSDFIADGFRIKKQGKSRLIIYGATYLPPLFIVLLAPGIFIRALSYAGVCCVLLVILLPLIMLYRGRYIKGFSGPKLVFGGKTTIYIGIAFAIFALVQAILIYQA